MTSYTDMRLAHLLWLLERPGGRFRTNLAWLAEVELAAGAKGESSQIVLQDLLRGGKQRLMREW